MSSISVNTAASPYVPPQVAPPPEHAQQAIEGRKDAPPPEPPTPKGGKVDDGFHGSPELADKGSRNSHDVSHMLAAFGAGQAPSTEELQSAKVQGKSGADVAKERQKDQEILDHVCGKGCGCGAGKASGGGDPLKALRERDDEVRKHEMDHFHEAGEFAASGPLYETATASNGQSYVTGGKVMVNVSEIEGDPQKTIEKMKKVEKAALKPAEPSDQDRRVATEAVTKRLKAERELADKRGKSGEQGDKPQ